MILLLINLALSLALVVSTGMTTFSICRAIQERDMAELLGRPRDNTEATAIRVSKNLVWLVVNLVAVIGVTVWRFWQC